MFRMVEGILVVFREWSQVLSAWVSDMSVTKAIKVLSTWVMEVGWWTEM